MSSPTPDGTLIGSHIEAGYFAKMLNALIYGAPGLFIGIIASAMRIAKDRKPLKDMFRTSLLCTGTGFVSALMFGDAFKEDSRFLLYIGALFVLSFCAEYILDVVPRIIIHIFNEKLEGSTILDLLKPKKVKKPIKKPKTKNKKTNSKRKKK